MTALHHMCNNFEWAEIEKHLEWNIFHHFEQSYDPQFGDDIGVGVAVDVVVHVVVDVDVDVGNRNSHRLTASVANVLQSNGMTVVGANCCYEPVFLSLPFPAPLPLQNLVC